MANRKVSSAEDMKGGEFMNIEVSKEHYEKLLVLSALWKRGTPARMVEGFVEDMWAQIAEAIPEDLALEDFQGLCVYMEQEV